MNIRFLFIFLILISISCNSGQEAEKQNQVINPDKEEEEKSTQPEPPNGEVLEVKFSHFSILITESGHGRAVPRFLHQNEDTVFLECFLSVNLSSLDLKIIPLVKYERIVIEQKFENALTLNYGEQRRADLKKWWQIDNEWKYVEVLANFTFKTLPFNQKKRKNSLKGEFEEIKSEVLKYRGDFVTDEDTNATQLRNFPLEVWASNCFIRLTIEVTDGQKIYKYLIFKQLYGC